MPNLVLFVYRYFEFLALAISIVNGYFLWRSAPIRVLYTFVVLNSIWLIVGTLHILSGYSTFYHVVFSPVTNMYSLLFWVYYFVWLWGLTAWVLFGDGTALIIQTGFVRGPGMDKPLGIKIFFGIGSVVIPIIFVLGQTTGWFAAQLPEIERLGSP